MMEGAKQAQEAQAQAQAQRQAEMAQMRHELKQQYLVSAYVDKVLTNLENSMVIDNVNTEQDKSVLNNQIVQIISRHVKICQVQIMDDMDKIFKPKAPTPNVPTELTVKKGGAQEEEKKPELPVEEPESTKMENKEEKPE